MALHGRWICQLRQLVMCSHVQLISAPQLYALVSVQLSPLLGAILSYYTILRARPIFGICLLALEGGTSATYYAFHRDPKMQRLY